ncbi:MAG: hypothetical protein M1814_001882 [Vezdaea aestivalis]|nr:MAG: hypothetical protein M1814_001882 [Vezdaea aestivalis]
MSRSPTRPAPLAGESHVSRTIRRFQSANALSSHAPSLKSSNPLPPRPLFPVQKEPAKLLKSESMAGHQSFAQRTRSNSDAALSGPHQPNPITIKHQLHAKKSVNLTSARLRANTLDAMLHNGPSNGSKAHSLQEMRRLIVNDGIMSDGDGLSSLRIYIWLILFNTPALSTDTYLAFVHRGPSPAYTKIRNDTFRTLATDPLFRRRVSESSLIRMLNAIAWKLHDDREAALLSDSPAIVGQPGGRGVGLDIGTGKRSRATTVDSSDVSSAEAGTYVQGMNVLAAPFLYAARSEAEAFTAFYHFLTVECPGYVRGAMDGVHRGLNLVDKILTIVDPELFSVLHSKGLNAKIYAFAPVLTLCACTPPLPEVLQLWDFLFSYGPHLNILCIVAQLILMRDQILSSPSPNQVLRSFPPLHASKIRILAMKLTTKIPDSLYAELVAHAK